MARWIAEKISWPSQRIRRELPDEMESVSKGCQAAISRIVARALPLHKRDGDERCYLAKSRMKKRRTAIPEPTNAQRRRKSAERCAGGKSSESISPCSGQAYFAQNA